MPLVQTRGAASAQGFGEFAQAAVAANYIEDVFSTYLYTGNGVGYPSGPTIINGIDLAGKGGMVWGKARSSAYSNWIYDTAKGVGDALTTNGTDAEYAGGATAGVNSFNSNGFGFGDNVYNENTNAATYVSWTFRKQPKFFDIVTYTGDGVAGRTVAHTLGSVPGSMFIKRTDDVSQWTVYHRSLASAANYLVLNDTVASASLNGNFNSTAPTSSVFTLGSSGNTNSNGGTYVAYLFAHDAGGFGLTGTDNVISCGSFTSGNPSSTPVTVTLGYEPQWILIKPNNASNSWAIYDNMRGWSDSTGGDAYLLPNTSGAEGTGTYGYPTATGFIAFNGFNTSTECIYIAIRRGPMKVPTLGTSVFSPNLRTTTEPNFVTNFVTDSSIYNYRPGDASVPVWTSRLLGGNGEKTSSTAAEVGLFGTAGYAFNTGVGTGSTANSDVLTWNFRRAPGYFDTVCYTNPASSPVDQTHSHNLGVVPTLVITKGRNQTGDWLVLLDSSILGTVKYLSLNLTDAAAPGITYTATTTQYTTSFLGNYNETQVAYLFATCAGVSKVGSYTGTGTTQTINCGFTAGSRFVMIKRTDSTGDWYVWDSARGIVAGNDPYLLLNSTAAEVTGTDYIDTAATGFEISSTAPAAINASGGTYIFLAIA